MSSALKLLAKLMRLSVAQASLNKRLTCVALDSTLATRLAVNSGCIAGLAALGFKEEVTDMRLTCCSV